MIRNEAEYQASVTTLQEHEVRLQEQRASLVKEGLTPSQVKRGMEPLVSFTEQIREEIAYYEQLKQGTIPDVQGFTTIGHALIALRIAQDISQKELANRMEVDPSQISRDERNEYHGITKERAERILQALGGEAHIQIRVGDSQNPKSAQKKISA